MFTGLRGGASADYYGRDVMLEQHILEERMRQLLNNRAKIESQIAFTRSEARQVERDASRLAAQEEGYRKELAWIERGSKAVNFMPQMLMSGAEDIPIALNVGNQPFQVSSGILRKDPDSLLCALTDPDSPIFQEGAVPAVACFPDRDWALFRYILNFLRDGTVPRDRQLLQRLYNEASFWNLTSLQRKIEQSTIKVYRRRWGVKGDLPGQLTEAELKEFTTALKKRQGATDPTPPTNADWWDSPPEWWGNKEATTNSGYKRDDSDIFEWWGDYDAGDKNYKNAKYEVKWNGHPEAQPLANPLDFEFINPYPNAVSKADKDKVAKAQGAEKANALFCEYGKPSPFLPAPSNPDAAFGHTVTRTDAIWPVF